MGTKGKGKESFVAQVQKLSAGATKHLATATQVMFTGGTYTPAQITTTFQSIVTLRAAVDAAQATAKAKVAAEEANMPSARAFTNAFVAYVKATYGGQPEVLADFGIVAQARAVPTVATKAAATAKGAATRAARKTMGSVQKLSVKGNVTGVTVTPITVTASPAATSPGTATAGASTPAASPAAAPHTAAATS